MPEHTPEPHEQLAKTMLQWLAHPELLRAHAEAVHTVARTLSEKDKRIARLEGQKDGAYRERDMLVSHLSMVYPSHLARHPGDDKSWDDDWRNIVFINGPGGQMSWHVHDSELHLFAHLEQGPNDWDGHTTEEKYERLVSPGA